MTLVDTSAWVEYLRGTGSQAHRRLREMVDGDEVVATTDVVVMEVLAGARDQEHLTRLRRLMLRCQLLPLGPADYEDAATIYRACRTNGVTPRSLIDCLVATVAIRTSTTVLHADRDFDGIARHTKLTVAGRH